MAVHGLLKAEAIPAIITATIKLLEPPKLSKWIRRPVLNQILQQQSNIVPLDLLA